MIYWGDNPKSYVSHNYRYDWNISEPWRLVTSHYQFFSDPSNGYMWLDVLSIKNKYNIPGVAANGQIQPGDLIYFFSNGEPYHVAIITKIENGDIYYAAHTTDGYDRSLSLNLGSDEARIIRIRNEAVLGYKT